MHPNRLFTMATLGSLASYLSKAHVAPEVFALRPDYRVLLIAIHRITPRPSDNTSEALLKQAESQAREILAKTPVIEMPLIKTWRDAYKAFNGKPQKNRNSVEALTRRVTSANGLPRINRLTDIYNAISVKMQIPFGGEDMDRCEGAPRCVRATGTEPFEIVVDGKTVIKNPDKREVIWMDDIGVTCRRWNWRQGPRTALHDGTSNALFIIDALDPLIDEALEAAGEELLDMLRQADPEIIASKRTIRAP